MSATKKKPLISVSKAIEEFPFVDRGRDVSIRLATREELSTEMAIYLREQIRDPVEHVVWFGVQVLLLEEWGIPKS